MTDLKPTSPRLGTDTVVALGTILSAVVVGALYAGGNAYHVALLKQFSLSGIIYRDTYQIMASGMIPAFYSLLLLLFGFLGILAYKMVRPRKSRSTRLRRLWRFSVKIRRAFGRKGHLRFRTIDDAFALAFLLCLPPTLSTLIGGLAGYANAKLIQRMGDGSCPRACWTIEFASGEKITGALIAQDAKLTAYYVGKEKVVIREVERIRSISYTGESKDKVSSLSISKTVATPAISGSEGR